MSVMVSSQKKPERLQRVLDWVEEKKLLVNRMDRKDFILALTENLIRKKSAIDFASIVAEEIINRNSGWRRWI